MYNSPSSRWRAVRTRDYNASSSFVYAVISTKIYCRPGCPSRLARRANVCFYDSNTDATAAGYRPCLRCKPDQLVFQLDSQKANRDVIERASDYIRQRDGKVKFAEVAKYVGLSTRYLYGLFQSVVGMTPAKYAASIKSVSAKQICFDNWPTTSLDVDTLTSETSDYIQDPLSWSTLLNAEYLDNPAELECGALLEFHDTSLSMGDWPNTYVVDDPKDLKFRMPFEEIQLNQASCGSKNKIG